MNPTPDNGFEGEELVKHPISELCLDHMFADGLDYGKSWTLEYFERELRCKRDSPQFWPAMMQVQSGVFTRFESHYLKKTGGLYTVVPAPDNEKVCERWERQIRTKGMNAIKLRAGTLSNPNAKLTDDERLLMSRKKAVAEIRFCLIIRTMQVEKVVRKNAPKLLDTGKKQKDKDKDKEKPNEPNGDQAP